MQYDFKKKKQEEVLIRSYFQPDDHNNPTFLVLPDERIMIFTPGIRMRLVFITEFRRFREI